MSATIDRVIRILYRAARRLETLRATQRRGKCHRCGGILTEMKRGLWRCEKCASEDSAE